MMTQTDLICVDFITYKQTWNLTMYLGSTHSPSSWVIFNKDHPYLVTVAMQVKNKGFYEAGGRDANLIVRQLLLKCQLSFFCVLLKELKI